MNFNKYNYFFLTLILILLLMVLNYCKLEKKNKNINKVWQSDEINYIGSKGIFIDNRDHKKYKWVKIGSQIWMAENLEFKTENGCIAFRNKDKKVKKFGYFYDGKTAQNISPKGWHLPSKEEYDTLCNYLGNNVNEVFKKITDKNSAFNPLNTGYYIVKDSLFTKNIFSRFGEFWTSTKENDTSKNKYCYNTFIINYFRKIALTGKSCTDNKLQFFTIRCIKDFN